MSNNRYGFEVTVLDNKIKAIINLNGIVEKYDYEEGFLKDLLVNYSSF